MGSMQNALANMLQGSIYHGTKYARDKGYLGEGREIGSYPSANKSNRYTDIWLTNDSYIRVEYRDTSVLVTFNTTSPRDAVMYYTVPHYVSHSKTGVFVELYHPDFKNQVVKAIKEVIDESHRT
jgi:hypothetical protein